MSMTYEGLTADQLNTRDASVDALRRRVYSDLTGKLRCLRRSPHTGKPIVEELNEVYGYFATVAFPSEAWAAKHGLT